LFKLIRTATALVLAVMFIVIFLGVFLRYVLNTPAFWTEEAARCLMFYMVLVGSSAATRQDRHPAISFVTDKFSQNLRRKWKSFLDVPVFIVLLVIFWQGILMAVDERIGRTPALRISFFWVYLALPVGAFLMMLQIIAKYLGHRKNSDAIGRKAALHGE
jgi:TRAP-type C4-dicarboxylate transport system permease small subunit